MRRWKALAGVAVLGLVVGAGIAWATIPDSNGVIHTCFKNSGWRVIDSPSASCKSSETAFDFNPGAVRPVIRTHTETLVPGAVIIWFSATAAFIGLVMVVYDIPRQYQLIGFGLLGKAALLFYRAYRKKNPGTFEQPNLNQRGLQYVGSELVLVEPIEQGSGKAKLGDGVWKVSGPELPAGARVRVTGVNGTILTVIPV